VIRPAPLSPILSLFRNSFVRHHHHSGAWCMECVQDPVVVEPRRKAMFQRGNRVLDRHTHCDANRPARFRGEPGKIAVCGMQMVTDHRQRQVKLLRRTRGAAGRAAGLMRNRIFECSRMQTKSRWASQLLDSGALEIPLSNAARVASRPRPRPRPSPRSPLPKIRLPLARILLQSPRIAAPATSLLSTMLIDLFQTHCSALA
jgi:hypothetical protein